ncbi:hypothetical protein COCVIDRAFT_31931 [Bipolaris victoriae FI3]|uniref:Uncharacterized protein n=1 Tax=Bipolaris victoriae (strain FI3) TaxID=930091 RepID=W7DXH2_BIPV3|nr:hypothetical protein COCVIDRAFT_31931 [Bipolaris victoriae FI3]
MDIVSEKLHSKHHLEDIDLILEEMKKDHKYQIREEIEELNRTLSWKEIKEINEIILWVMTSQVELTLADMSAVLACGSSNESDQIQFRLNEIKHQILKSKSSYSRSATGSTGSVQPVEAEIELVYQFLKNVSPKRDDYDKKALDRVLWSHRLNDMKATISYDKENAHLKIALTCLQVFARKCDEYTEQLLPYARTYLLHPLSRAKPGKVNIMLKAELGKSLVKLFQDPLCIDKMFCSKMEHMGHTTWLETEDIWLRKNCECWLYTDEGVKEVLKWFSDSDTTSAVSKQRQRLNQ